MTDRHGAYELLKGLGAPARLIRHAELVVEAADQLLVEFQLLGVRVDSRVVELGAMLHDAGKTVHTEELFEPGTLHEQAGEALLLANGVQSEVARCCVSHGAWQAAGVSLEERTVALADKLWKGKRQPDLELSVIDEIAAQLGVSRWDIFERLDNAFENIASEGAARVRQTMAEG